MDLLTRGTGSPPLAEGTGGGTYVRIDQSCAAFRWKGSGDNQVRRSHAAAMAIALVQVVVWGPQLTCLEARANIDLHVQNGGHWK